jgi:hypothetical protein
VICRFSGFFPWVGVVLGFAAVAHLIKRTKLALRAKRKGRSKPHESFDGKMRKPMQSLIEELRAK